MTKAVLLPLVSFAMIACAPSGKDDSRKISRSSIKSYVDTYRNPPKRMLFNDHPAASVRVTYEVTEPGETKGPRQTVVLKAFENRVIGGADSREKIIATDFEDPWYRSSR